MTTWGDPSKGETIMPYIKQKRRDPIDHELEGIIECIELYTVGDMNYAITRMIHKWVQTHGGVSYPVLSKARAILNDADDEFYRTVMLPYENLKCKENGPVSELDKENSDDS